MELNVNEMGEDFTLKINGTCKLQNIVVWGYGYGGTLKISGKGTLIVNENKKMDNAIKLEAEVSNSVVNVGKDVKLKACAGKKNGHAIYIDCTKKASKGIVFAGKNAAALNKKVKKEKSGSTTNYYIKENIYKK